MPKIVHLKQIIYFDQHAIVGCDGNCSKAWGIQNRPRVNLSENEDDYAYLADGELGTAPKSPGTYEGGERKPYLTEGKLNKWCIRECERSEINKLGTAPVSENLTLKDWGKRVYNIPGSEPEEEGATLH